MTHTKGTWTYRQQIVAKHGFYIESIHGEFIGEAGGGIMPDSEVLANAKLIAAAPELLRSLGLMTSLCRLKYGNLDKDIFAEIEKAEAIIKKATE